MAVYSGIKTRLGPYCVALICPPPSRVKAEPKARAVKIKAKIKQKIYTHSLLQAGHTVFGFSLVLVVRLL